MNRAHPSSSQRWQSIQKSIAQSAPGNMLLHNARLPQAVVETPSLPVVGDGLVEANLKISNGSLLLSSPTMEIIPGAIDLDGAIVWPCTVDCHTHIDKGQTWPRIADGDGTFNYAINHAGPAVHNFSSESDQRIRSEFMLRAAYAHGCVALRSHIDTSGKNFDFRFGILSELAQDWADLVNIQLCPMTGNEDDLTSVSDLAARSSLSPGHTLSVALSGFDEIDSFIDHVIRLADQFSIGLDFHADENLNPDSHHLDAIAQGVLRHRFQGPVLVGHCCALSIQDQDMVKHTLDQVAEAGINIVSLPHSNSYLQDRFAGRSPRQRGFAPVKEMIERGIRVALASDNARDAFNAYGDMDLPELFRDSVRMLQLDHPVGDWPAAVLRTPAEFMGMPELGRFENSLTANMILFPARNWSEFVARPQSQRIVLRDGTLIDSTPPDFSELDHLVEMLP